MFFPRAKRSGVWPSKLSEKCVGGGGGKLKTCKNKLYIAKFFRGTNFHDNIIKSTKILKTKYRNSVKYNAIIK